MIDTYGDIDIMWYDAVKSLLRADKIDSRDGHCSEVTGYVARIHNCEQSLLNNKRRKLSHKYAAAELLWYFSGTDRGDLISTFAKSYERFLTDGKAAGAYGPRLFTNDDDEQGGIYFVIKELMQNPRSRRALVPIFNIADLRRCRNSTAVDVPCTSSLQFLVRDGRLNCIGTMRSNDVWLGMPYDIWSFCQIQRFVAAKLFLAPGWYQHQVGSLHLYDRNREAASEVQTVFGGELKTFCDDWYRTERNELPIKEQLALFKNCAIQSLEGKFLPVETWLNIPPAFANLCSVANGTKESLL